MHPTLLVPDPSRSLGDGAIVKEAFNHDKNAWGGRWLYSLARHYGFNLDAPFSELKNNLQNLDVEIRLGVLVCVTGASGSGKSSLVHDIVYKKLASLRYDSRILAGSHDDLE